MKQFKTMRFPRSRVASIDVCEIGKQKHHVAGLIELDVTESREKIRSYRREKGKISFNAWLISTIGRTVHQHEHTAAFLKGKRNVVVFQDINISMVVDNQIVIREIMNMTVLFDHDVIDGANMARFISDLSDNIERGSGL